TFAERPDAVALRTPDDAVRMTYAELRERIRDVAAGLAALGVQRGDAVGLMMVNRPEFHVVDAAAMLLGAVPFSLYNTSPPEQVGCVMGDAGNGVGVCERRFEPVVRAARERGAKALEQVVVLEELDELVARGDPGFDLEAEARAVKPNDLLTLIYTSGTTGPPKGVQVTHANMLAELRGVHAAVPVRSGGRQLSYLPSAHIADRWASHYSALMTYGATGTPVDGVEVRLDEDGELLVRGGTVMAGYRNRPDLTAEAIDADGWLHTGDIARIDEDGYVWIVDRKKELIINAAGKNMSPANIE